jgi:DNA-binding MarR family transcriptional regulator
MFERLTDIQEKNCCSGIPLPQCHVLLEVEERGKATTGQMAKSLNLDKSTLSRTIDGLVNLGLLKRLSHPEDRRLTPIALTEQGNTICNAINTANDDYYRHVLEQIPISKQELVIASFDILVQAFLEHEQHLDSKSSSSDTGPKRKENNEQ